MRILINASLASSLCSFRGPLIREMIRRGYEVHTSAPSVAPEFRDRIAAMGAIPHELPLDRTGFGVGGDIRYFGGLRVLIRQLAPDVVLNYTIKPNIWGSLAARFEKVPAVSMVTGLGYAFAPSNSVKERLVKWLAQRLYGVAVRTNRVILFQNPDDVADFTAEGLLRDHRQVRMINGSGVDLDHYAPKPLPREARFVMVARLLGAKGIREYAAACALVRAACPDAECLLVGSAEQGPDSVAEDEVRKLCAGAIDYLGALDDVRPAIARSSVFVLPSYREGTPRSSLEAMAMGRAVITTDAPGCRETVIDGENGLLVPVGDADALAKAMIELAADPDRRTAMGAKSIERARSRFAVDKVNDAIIDALTVDMAGKVLSEGRLA